jgi:hypothetical protein
VHCHQESVRSLKNAEVLARYTYDGNYPAHPRQPFVVQHPNPVTEVSLNDDRKESCHKASVYATEMGMCEAFRVAKSSNKPIIDIRPGECSLNSLQQEDKISYAKFALTSQKFRMISKTNLKILRVVSHLGNCSYTRLNLGE